MPMKFAYFKTQALWKKIGTCQKNSLMIQQELAVAEFAIPVMHEPRAELELELCHQHHKAR